MCFGVSCLVEVLWARGSVFTSGRSVRVQWMTSSAFSLRQQNNKSHAPPSREKPHASAKQKKKSNRHAVAPRTRNSEVGQSQQNPTRPETHTRNWRSRRTPPITVRDQELHPTALPIPGFKAPERHHPRKRASTARRRTRFFEKAPAPSAGSFVPHAYKHVRRRDFARAFARSPRATWYSELFL